MEYPAILYKRGTMYDWNGLMCDYQIVADEEEAALALADGWVRGMPDAEAPGDAEPAVRKAGRPRKAAH